MSDDETIEDEPVVDSATVQLLTALYDANDGKLTAELLVAEAADPDSPLHDRFLWDDVEAAHRYRLAQARVLIHCVTRVLDRPVRAFVHVASTGSYHPVGRAMASDEWRAEIVARFARDAQAFEQRWKDHRFVADHYAEWVAAQV